MQPQNNGDPNQQYAPNPQPVTPPPAPASQPIYDNFGEPVENTGGPQDNPYARQFAEELAAENPPEPTPPPKPPKKSGPKKLIVALVFALLFAGLIGGGVAAFTQYQKPERVAEDALTHLLAAKHLQVDVDTNITFDKSVQENLDIEVKGLKIAHRTAEMDSQLEATLSMRYAEKDFDLKGAAIVEETGDMYFRLYDVQRQVETWVEADFGAVLSDKTKDELKKLENKWIKYGIDQMKKDAPDFAAAYTCQLEAVAKLSDDEAYRGEVIAAYRLHPVLKTVGSAKYSGTLVGYEVEVDEKAYEKFNESLESTDFGRAVDACAQKTAPLEPIDEEAEETENAEEPGEATGEAEDTGSADDPVAADGTTTDDVADTEETLSASTLNLAMVSDIVPEEALESDRKATAKAVVWVDMISHELKKIDATVEFEGTASSTSTFRFGYDPGATVDIPGDTVKAEDWFKQVEPTVKAVEADIDKTRTKQSESEKEAAKTVSKTAELVRERAEVFRDKHNRFPDTAAELEAAELELSTESPRIVGVLPKAAGSVAYKRCAVGAQVAYRDIDRNKYVAIGLGGVSSGDVTVLCS